MELRHLRYFIAVAEELSFVRAAERLHMAQPPLSSQIKALEQEIGVQLFERSHRATALTSAGKLFLQEAYRVMEQVDHAVAIAQRASRGELGRLRLAYISSAANGVLPRLIKAFRERSPGVSLELRELVSSDLLDGVENGSVDIGVFRLEEREHLASQIPGVALQLILRDPYVVALPEDHPLASWKALPLAALKDENFVLFPRHVNASLHQTITRHCQNAGFAPRIVQEANMMQTLVSLVAAGLGITFVPASMQRTRWEGVVYRPLEGPGIETQLFAAWKQENTSGVVQSFLETLREGSCLTCE